MANGKSPNNKTFKEARLASCNPISKTTTQLTISAHSYMVIAPENFTKPYHDPIILLPTSQCLIVGSVKGKGLVKFHKVCKICSI